MYGRQSIALWLIAAIGLGLVAYGGYRWYTAPVMTPDQLEGSVALNYRADVARMRIRSSDGELEITDEWERKHREAIRQELQAEAREQRETSRSWMLAGLAALIFSLGRIFAVPLFIRRG